MMQTNLTIPQGSYALVAMSGGVDSSVVATMLLEQGVRVIGVTMLHKKKGQEQDLADVKAICAKLGIEHIGVNLVQQYEEFLQTQVRTLYAQGLTPNPCILCNEQVKFGLFFNNVLSNNLLQHQHFPADCYWASGHYATVSLNSEGYYQIGKGQALAKDQSYFLYRLKQDVLKRLRFPLGSFDKSYTRQLAAKYNLIVKDKVDSQDFCLGLEELRPLDEKPVDLVDKNGHIIGVGEGLSHYTIGQRRGIGIGSPQALYVIALDAKLNRVLVGHNDDLLSKQFTINNAVWTGHYHFPLTAKVKVRSASKEKDCIINQEGEQFLVTLQENERAITPGQSAVFYNNDKVIGGGYIVRRE